MTKNLPDFKAMTRTEVLTWVERSCLLYTSDAADDP